MRSATIITALLLLSTALPLSAAPAKKNACPGMGDLITRGSYGVAETSGKIIAGGNLDEPLLPASIIKVATVLAAMRVLGPDFRFTTEFYRDRESNLYIKGYGDPTLVSEELAVIAERLRARGLRHAPAVYVDDTAFDLEGPVPGQTMTDNPYDAPVGALAVNFNTVAVFKDKHGNIVSGEAQTPTIPLMHELAVKRAPGRMRLNICLDGANARERSARHGAELFRAFFQAKGIDVGRTGGRKAVPAGAELLLRHQSSQQLTEISEGLMRSSSNFTANLIFLTVGAKRYGYPATWAKARRALEEEMAAALGPEAAGAMRIMEGSGLSRETRVSARAMLTLLQRFRPYRAVFQDQGGIARKSGTLTGVYNLAGYLPNGRAYVIMLNQGRNTRDSVLARLNQQHGAEAR